MPQHMSLTSVIMRQGWGPAPMRTDYDTSSHDKIRHGTACCDFHTRPALRKLTPNSLRGINFYMVAVAKHPVKAECLGP